MSKSPGYVSSREFRLRFLRAEQFDVQLAAERIFYYFDWKLNLYGEEKLGKEIEISDLNEEATRFLYNGHMRILPHRDQAGRLIALQTKESYYETNDLMDRRRFGFYLLGVGSQDVVTQKKGLAGIGWYMANDGEVSWTVARQNAASQAALTKASPVRFSAVHLCSTHPGLPPIIHFAKFFMEKSFRDRMTAHVGTPQEIMYELVSRGIPRAVLPITDDGTVKYDSVTPWIIAQRSLEFGEAIHERTKEDVILVPKDVDVLSGRGKSIEESMGNLRFRKVIEANCEMIEKCTRFNRQVYMHSIWRRLIDDGIRFLKPAENQGVGWVEMGGEAARAKISHTFRNFKARGHSWGQRGRRPRSETSDCSLDLSDGVKKARCFA